MNILLTVNGQHMWREQNENLLVMWCVVAAKANCTVCRLACTLYETFLRWVYSENLLGMWLHNISGWLTPVADFAVWLQTIEWTWPGSHKYIRLAINVMRRRNGILRSASVSWREHSVHICWHTNFVVVNSACRLRCFTPQNVIDLTCVAQVRKKIT